MIDIHCHILPEVDDGSKSLEESIEMARIAESEGIKTIVNTSHYHFDFKYKKGEELKAILKDFNQKLKQENINVEVILGNELYYTEDLIGKLEELDFYTINDSKYLLIEFPPTNIPKNIVDVIYEIKLRGYTPILAHVERYPAIQEDPNVIFDAIQEGALIQINASSIVGKNGPDAENTCDILLKNNMVHVIGTDAHSSTRRRPLIKEAYEYVCNEFGNKLSDELFYKNAKTIIDNEAININTPSRYEKKKSFFSRIFKR